jgi:ABC-type polar amino acid transport system ATPase subunit
MLTLHNVSKAFKDKVVLKDITLQVPKGQIALLLGSSGTGKSTLLRILNKLEVPTTGTIFLDNKPLSSFQQIGMVFQHFNLFQHITVEHNITLALEKVLGWRPEKAQAHAQALLMKYKLEALADYPISTLSGGQKQRLAIARAVALSPQVLCMDEPTSALDPSLTSQVITHIQQLASEGFIVLVATHDRELIASLDCTIYLMDQGHIIESAHSKEFQADPTRFKHLYTYIQGSWHMKQE